MARLIAATLSALIVIAFASGNDVLTSLGIGALFGLGLLYMRNA